MDVVSACPLRVGSILWQPRPGVFVLTVVCKATYTLLPTESPLARDQDPPNEGDNHWNDDERRSLHAASDLAPFKPRADVFLVGHAYAPQAQPVSSLTARLIVGDVDKAIEVHADWAWTQDGQLRQGARFTRMPLRYERAGGGPTTSNPVGMRPDAPPDRYGQVPVPNLQPPGHHVARPQDAVPPVGLGPIAPEWPGRAAKLYGNAAGWNYRLGLAQPLPQGIDPGFFNVAPPDQQTAELRGNERLVLENLHPDHPRLVTSLPGLSPLGVVERAGAAPQALPLRCDTLSVDTDRGTCNLVWRGQVVLARPDEVGRVVITAAAQGGDATETIVGGMPVAAVLPFVGADVVEQEDDATRTMPGVLAGRATPALPFREVSPWEGTPALAMATEGAARPREWMGTLLSTGRGSEKPLPFVGPAEAAETPVPEAAPMLGREDAPVRIATPPPPAPGPAETPAQPEMIGPLATPEMFAAAEAPPVANTARAGEPSPDALAPAAAEPPAPLSLPLDRYPLERCAAIAASIARTRPEKERVLAEHDLEPEMWAALDKHWNETVRAQAGRGKTALLKAYDAAYVAQCEKERGPIRVEEYARIVVAQERGSADEALAALTLPRGALIRIQRVWLGRVAVDAELGKSVRVAVEAAREQ